MKRAVLTIGVILLVTAFAGCGVQSPVLPQEPSTTTTAPATSDEATILSTDTIQTTLASGTVLKDNSEATASLTQQTTAASTADDTATQKGTSVTAKTTTTTTQAPVLSTRPNGEPEIDFSDFE